MPRDDTRVPQDDHALAAGLARKAGELLLAVRRGELAGAELGAEGDETSETFLASALAQERPGDTVLSEEAADRPERLHAERVWIIDPLDGTREFGEPPRTDWAVHVALWARGDLAAGAVALPARGLVVSTADPPPVPERRSGRLVVSRSRPPSFAGLIAARLGLELTPLGSAGAKTAAVLLGEADLYLHAGGQHEWDSAAPVAVARAAGLFTSRLDGSALQYNQPDPLQPDLVVCRPELAIDVLGALAALAEHR